MVIDATYKTEKCNLPLLTVMIVDGSGHGRSGWHLFRVRECASFVESATESVRNSYDYEHTTCVLIEKHFVPNNTLKRHYTGKNVN